MTDISLDDYQLAALRTAGRRSDGSADSADPATGDTIPVTDAWMRVCWALGLTGEAGEFAELVKKELFHQHPANFEKQAKELGDVLWYLAVAARGIGYDLSSIAQLNLDKLRARYPDGFSEQRSRNREVPA